MSDLHYVLEDIDDGTGMIRQDYMFKCACSNVDPEHDEPVMSEAFYPFWDSRFNPPHLHVQCFDCEQTYCPFQQCVPPPTAEVIGARS